MDFARAAGPIRRPRQRTSTAIRPAAQQILYVVADAPAWMRNGRHDILVGELSTQSELFSERWASRDVMHRRSGQKRLQAEWFAAVLG